MIVCIDVNICKYEYAFAYVCLYESAWEPVLWRSQVQSEYWEKNADKTAPKFSPGDLKFLVIS